MMDQHRIFEPSLLEPHNNLKVQNFNINIIFVSFQIFSSAVSTQIICDACTRDFQNKYRITCVIFTSYDKILEMNNFSIFLNVVKLKSLNEILLSRQ